MRSIGQHLSKHSRMLRKHVLDKRRAAISPSQALHTHHLSFSPASSLPSCPPPFTNPVHMQQSKQYSSCQISSTFLDDKTKRLKSWFDHHRTRCNVASNSGFDATTYTEPQNCVGKLRRRQWINKSRADVTTHREICF